MTLFVGESAPDSNKFFYFGNNPMLTYTRKAIEQALGSDSGDIRDRFKALGWYLDDLSLAPANKLAPAMRKLACHAARQTLSEPTPVYHPQTLLTVAAPP